MIIDLINMLMIDALTLRLIITSLGLTFKCNLYVLNKNIDANFIYKTCRLPYSLIFVFYGIPALYRECGMKYQFRNERKKLKTLNK